LRPDRSADRAVFKQIADHYRQMILDGQLRPGDRLPSERELQDLHSASRVTTRNAMGILVNEGLVVARHGIGVFVADKPPIDWRGLAEQLAGRLRRHTVCSHDPPRRNCPRCLDLLAYQEYVQAADRSE
jgi:DNA-binding GntR family transcriptional regulator